MKGILKLVYNLLVNDKAKFTALLVGITFAFRSSPERRLNDQRPIRRPLSAARGMSQRQRYQRMRPTRANKRNSYCFGSYRIATAPEPNSSRLTSLKSVRFDRPASSVGP